ncbi:MAG: ATP-binding cassette domain-containing protein [Myxococcales bacterium FL481]|nr:MAG: ATP-binding cassette domain-containing protein [Myxococcales bacterium FL481]
MIEVRGLERTFGTVKAVDGVSFVAEDGQVTGLLGPNGAGKTTTMRILSGLVHADAGSAFIDGIDVGRRPREAQRRLGILPDARGLYPRLTARENIRYFGELHGVAIDRLDATIGELSHLLGMDALLERRVEGFSQGERAKVAIARALVHRPSSVILDEPANGLDVMSTRALRSAIESLRDRGVCVVLSSHVMQEVSALCDRIVIIARGRVVASGRPDQIRDQAGTEDLEDAFVQLAQMTEQVEDV